MTVSDFCGVQDFGSLLDLMCVTEAATENGFLSRPLPLRSVGNPLSAPEPLDPPGTSDISWNSAIPILKRLLGASFEFRDAVTLTDALNSDLGELARALLST